MKAACFQDIENIITLEVADPVIESPGDCIVKVTLAGLCGSDLHPFYGRETGIDLHTIMGHEFVGEVVACGADCRIPVGSLVGSPFTTSCGNCFYCRKGFYARCEVGQLFGWREKGEGLHGGQAEYVRVPHANGTLVSLEDIPPEIGLLLGDNLSTGYYCAEMAEVGPQGVYAIIGCGTVGLLCAISCLQKNAQQLFAFDPQPHRLEVARRLGVQTYSDEQAFLAAISESTEGRGADGVMELVGLPAAQDLAFRSLRPGGILSVVGCHCGPNFSFSPVDAFDKNLTYRTGRCSARFYFDRLDSLIKNYESELVSMISHKFTIDEAAHAYDIFANRKDGCLKAAFVME